MAARDPVWVYNGHQFEHEQVQQPQHLGVLKPLQEVKHAVHYVRGRNFSWVHARRHEHHLLPVLEFAGTVRSF